MLETEVQPVGFSETVVERAEREASLGQDDFLRMLVAQLENQDPLNPQEGTEFTAQLATFSSLEQLISMRAGVDALVEQLGGGSGGGLSGLSGVTGDLLAAGVIGKDVLAEGSQFSLTTPGGFDPATDRAPLLAFELEGNTERTRLDVIDSAGQVRASLDLGRLDQGHHEVPDAALREVLQGLPAGSYHYDVVARLGDREVGATRFAGGRVTATSLGGEQPLLLIGDAAVPVSDVTEIREPRPDA